jgi:hypothetical protein
MKEHEKKELEKLEELRKTIEASPLTQQIVAEKAAAILATRTEAAGKIEALRKEQADILPKLLADREAKEEKFKKAKAALDAAGGEFQAARATLSSEMYQRDNEISQQETILYETADPAIDSAVAWFRDKFDDLQKPGRISSRGQETVRNIFTDTQTVTTESNRGAVLGAMQFCRVAIKRLEALRLSPEFDIEGIRKLKDALPSTEVYQEVTSEGPLPGSKININPRIMFKSDDQLAWEMGKLMEKADKLLSRPKKARA